MIRVTWVHFYIGVFFFQLFIFLFIGSSLKLREELRLNSPQKEFCCKIDNLDSTEDGEASEESHRSSNQTQLANKGHL